jgi:transcriptional regulator with XRE-family HTH domain
MTSFPATLRSLRENRGHTQGGLATLAGLPPSVISLYESGSRAPSFDSLIALADALEVSLDDLAGRPLLRDPVFVVTASGEQNRFRDLDEALDLLRRSIEFRLRHGPHDDTVMSIAIAGGSRR